MQTPSESRRPPHPPGCGCHRPLTGRRALLGLVAAGTLGVASGAHAKAVEYEAMLFNCIDPRFTAGSHAFADSLGMRGRFSQFVIAGGPIGAIHPRFATWHEAFWDNLAVSVQLHKITRVVALTHRDCGAAKLALGEAAVATPAAETSSHSEALRQFRAEVARRQPSLSVTTGIMALDGSVLMVA